MEQNTSTPIPSPRSHEPLTPPEARNTWDMPAEGAPNDIRTMRADIAETIKEQNETLVSIALAEKKKKEEEEERAKEIAQAQKKETEEPSRDKNQAPRPRGRIVLIVVVILIFATAGASLVLLLPKLKTLSIPSLPSSQPPAFNTPPPEPVTPITPINPPIVLDSSLIPAQSEKKLSINDASPAHLLAMIAVEETAGLPPGNIENLYFTEDASPQEGAPLETIPLTAGRLLAFAGITAPDIFMRTLQNSFMTGLFGEQKETTPFLVLKVSDYETGLAGMLALEKDIPDLFHSIFGTVINPTATQKKASFHNITILGRDTRSFEISPSQSIVYAFADANTIVIAGSTNTLGEIMLRIAGK